MSMVANETGMEDGVQPVVDVCSEESLLQRHRKEKKELQAKITSLKHSVPKNDRAKKKEITNEIARLEADLTTKHEQELEVFRQKKNFNVDLEQNGVVEDEKNSASGEEVESSTDNNKKVSKAQKRREKKETKARENERVIAESMEEVKQGVRYKEFESFNKLLAEKGLKFHMVPSDGDCLYNAVAHQLLLSGLTVQVKELRQETATIMKNRRDDYLPFLTNHDGDTLNDEQFDEYCAKLLQSGIWGGQPELVALSTHYQRPIEVLQANATPIIIGEEFAGSAKPLVITYHRHAYRLGEHYNSTEPASENKNEESMDDF